MKRNFCFLMPTLLLILNASAQTNTFPSTGMVGIGVTSPNALLHIRSIQSLGLSSWIAVDKNPNEETGIQFRKSGAVQFYLFSDNVDNDALKILSGGVPGESDASPRIHIPYSSPNLYMVQSGGNVGIGTVTPAHKLDVNGVINATGILINGAPFAGGGSQWTTSGSNIAFTATNGKVGIGVTNPAYSLDVNGGIHSREIITNGGGDFLLGKDDGRNQGSILHNRALSHSDWGIGTDNLVINYGGDFEGGVNIQGPKVILDGNVGIGTHLPDSKLTVKGDIHTREVRVDLSGAVGPDYVFERNYDLLSLSNLEAYINKNKHLPEVPSAKEMEEHGLNLKEMNLLLLKKVEELTLHIIELEKRMKQIERK